MSASYILLAITAAFDAMSILFGLSGLGMGILDTGMLFKLHKLFSFLVTSDYVYP